MTGQRPEGRTVRRRPSGKTLVLGAAAIVVAALGAGIIVHQATGPNVPKSLATQVPRAPQVAANDPVVAAPAGADVASAIDETGSFTRDFAGNVVDVRLQVQGKQKPAPTVVDDQCLSDWAKENLAALAPNGAYEVVEVCGRPTAVLAGPAGADSKVLVYGAIQESAPAGMKSLFAESTSNRMAFVAVRSDEQDPAQRAQLMAAAVLPAGKVAAPAPGPAEHSSTVTTDRLSD